MCLWIVKCVSSNDFIRIGLLFKEIQQDVSIKFDEDATLLNTPVTFAQRN